MTEHFLRRAAVEARVGLSRSTIYDKMEKGEFPSQVKLGGKVVGWLESEIASWQEEQIAKRDLSKTVRS